MRILRALRAAVLVLALLIAAGCATSRINWDELVGTYTLDQAIVDLGPPDRQAKLSDGATVAEWLTRKGRAFAYTPGPGYYGNPYWPGYYAGGYYPTYIQNTPDAFIRLTFGPDGKLAAWRKVSR